MNVFSCFSDVLRLLRAFPDWDKQCIDERVVPMGRSVTRTVAGPALCSMVLFSLDLEGMLMGQCDEEFVAYSFEK